MFIRIYILSLLWNAFMVFKAFSQNSHFQQHSKFQGRYCPHFVDEKTEVERLVLLAQCSQPRAIFVPRKHLAIAGAIAGYHS